LRVDGELLAVLEADGVNILFWELQQKASGIRWSKPHLVRWEHGWGLAALYKLSLT
jgi:hypothetical protein